MKWIPLRIKKILRPLYVPIASYYYDTFRAPRRYHHLYDTIRTLKAKSILEVGVWNGKRAVKMINEALQHTPKILYVGYDLFEDLGEAGYQEEFSKRPPSEEEVKILLKKTGVEILLFKGNTLKTLPESIEGLPKIDFIFIDGGHSVETIASDWLFIQKLMHDTSVVIFDDYWRNRSDAGCKVVVDAIDRALFDVSILPEIDTFNNPDFGKLEISFARVVKKK